MPAMLPWRGATYALASAAFVMSSIAKGNESAERNLNRVTTPGTSNVGVIAPQPQPVGVMINQNLGPEQALVLAAGGTLFIRRTDLLRTGLHLPELATEFVLGGHEYVSLSSVEGLSVNLSDQEALLDITANPTLFLGSRFEKSSQSTQLDEIIPAAFISYDLTFSRWNNQNSAFAFLDAGVSGSWGLIGSTVAVQNAGAGIVRLDSYFQRDWPNKRVRLVIGDTVTRPTEWSAQTRFAGVRLGTDFSLAPMLITFPVPTLVEAATQPSTVDLLSAASRQTLSVQPGPFSIDYQPVFSGAGEVTMTITDANGLRRQVTSSFYTSPRLLRRGLVDFSIEAGLVRRNYGIESFDYGPLFAAGYLRFGLTDALTVGGRLELSSSIQMGGVGLGWILSPIGEFGLAGAMSQSPLGLGTLWRAQFQRIAPTHSFTLSYQQDNGRFMQVGANIVGSNRNAGRAPRKEVAMAGSFSLGRLGDVAFGLAESFGGAGQTFRTMSLGLNGDLRSAFYNVGVRHNRFGERSDNGAYFSVSMPLGARSSASVRVDDRQSLAMVSLAPPTDSGVGYQIVGGRDAVTGQPIVDVSTLARTPIGDFEFAAGRNAGGQGVRMSARGAITAIGGQVVAAPRLFDGFAFVDLESEQEVTLFLENRPVVAKGGAGKAAVMIGLQPYAENRIAIDTSSLPITADIETAEKMVVPGYRQAVRVSFGGASQSAVTIKLIDADGALLPPGLEVRASSGTSSITGYDGLAYLADVKGGEVITVNGPALRCEAKIPSVLQIDEGRQLGPITCLRTLPVEPKL